MRSGSLIGQIEAAIDEAVVILVLTPSAARSNWVRQEMEIVVAHVNENRMRPPIIIEAEAIPANVAIPLTWRTYYYYRVRDDADYFARVCLDIGSLKDTRLQVDHGAPKSDHAEVSQRRPVIQLEKDQVAPLDRYENLTSGVRFEMWWGVSAEASMSSTQKEFDVDFALFVCHGSASNPSAARMRADPLENDIVYFAKTHHTYPVGSNAQDAAISRSSDERYGGTTDAPDETGRIYFSKLPSDVVRIVVYVHIFKASERFIVVNGERTHQLFKHANVRFDVYNLADDAPIVAISLRQKYPDNWGIVLCEFLKDSSGKWSLRSIEQPIDGDRIDVCWDKYPLVGDN